MACFPQHVVAAMFDQTAAVGEQNLKVVVRIGVGKARTHIIEHRSATVNAGQRHLWGSLGHSRLGERRQRGEGDQQGEGCALQAKHSIVFRVLPQATSHPTGIGAIGQRQPPLGGRKNTHCGAPHRRHCR